MERVRGRLVSGLEGVFSLLGREEAVDRLADCLDQLTRDCAGFCQQVQVWRCRAGVEVCSRCRRVPAQAAPGWTGSAAPSVWRRWWVN